MTLTALIPARGGSKGIPKKNIKSFDGKPLIQWTIELALSVSEINRVVVSTDDDEIASLSHSLGAEIPFIRPPNLALDTTPGIASVFHALEQLPETSQILLLQPTSPLRSLEDIESTLEISRSQKASSIVSLTESKSPTWMYTINHSNQIVPISKEPRCESRQIGSTTYILNGAIFFATRDFILEEQSLINHDTIGYIMPPERSIDIDTLYDWKVAEYIKRTQND